MHGKTTRAALRAVGVLLPLVATAACAGFRNRLDGSGVTRKALAMRAAVGDFNRDDHQDLAVPTFGRGSVSVLLGKGDGTFRVPVEIPVGRHATGLVVTDLDGDGNHDIAAASLFDGPARVLLGRGDGAFQPASPLHLCHPAWTLLAGDVNEDGRQDLVIPSSGRDGASVYLGVGAGAFRPAATIEAARLLGSMVRVRSLIALGDFDGDGHADVVAQASASPALKMLRGRGDGTFEPKSVSRIGRHGAGQVDGSFEVADFNSDGRQDVALLTFDNDRYPVVLYRVTTILGEADGTFALGSDIVVDEAAAYLAAGDFNADGRPDLAVGRYRYPSPADEAAGRHLTGVLSLFLGVGDGSFREGPSTEVSASPFGVTTGDLNGDGRHDLILSNGHEGTVSVLLGHGDGTFAAGVTTSVEAH